MSEFILNAPPTHNALADSKKLANQSFIGGKFYQETWGAFNSNRSAGSSAKPSIKLILISEIFFISSLIPVRSPSAIKQ
jgi:hypothetical protein